MFCAKGSSGLDKTHQSHPPAQSPSPPPILWGTAKRIKLKWASPRLCDPEPPANTGHRETLQAESKSPLSRFSHRVPKCCSHCSLKFCSKISRAGFLALEFNAPRKANLLLSAEQLFCRMLLLFYTRRKEPYSRQEGVTDMMPSNYTTPLKAAPDQTSLGFNHNGKVCIVLYYHSLVCLLDFAYHQCLDLSLQLFGDWESFAVRSEKVPMGITTRHSQNKPFPV